MNEENKCDIGRQLQDSLQCSASKTPLNNLDENIHIIILAEILFKKSNFTSKLNICVDHKEIILQNVSKRQRRTRCGFEETPILRFHHQGKGADRHATADMCSNIHQSIGAIIPVGTRKQYLWDFLIQGKIITTPLIVLFDADLVAPADVVESDTDSDNDEPDEDVPDVVLKQRKVFVCPDEGCMSSFKTSSNLDALLMLVAKMIMLHCVPCQICAS